MKKTVKSVGVLTLCWGRNYGGLLQSYALQETIRSLDMECSIINFRRKSGIKDETDKTGVMRLVWYVVTAVSSLICKFTVDRLKAAGREEKYLRFFDENICFTEEIYCDESDFFANPPIFDAYVVGSDVVWYPRREAQFMLSFAPVEAIRIAYAASFGRDVIPDELKSYMGEGISKFDYVSVREQQGRHLVAELAGRDADWVLDPTLLFGVEYWRSIAEPAREASPYVLVYCLDKTFYMREVASYIAKKTGSNVVSIEGGNWEFQNPRKKVFEYLVNTLSLRVDCRYDLGPREFLGLFDQASYVVTNSFHGMVFCVIFRKPFVSILRRGMGARQRSFARMLGITSGIYKEGGLLPDIGDLEQDYDSLHAKLDKLRSKSMLFLRKALQIT